MNAAITSISEFLGVFFQILTEFFWLVGIQEMGIPEAINHAIEQLPIGKWFFL